MFLPKEAAKHMAETLLTEATYRQLLNGSESESFSFKYKCPNFDDKEVEVSCKFRNGLFNSVHVELSATLYEGSK